MLITVLLAAELLFNPSLDKKNGDGKGPEGWTLPKDCRVEYHEIAYLSDDFVVSFQRRTAGLLLEQKLAAPVADSSSLTCVYDAVFPIEKYPIEWEVKDGYFRLFTKVPMTVQINSVSLRDDVSPLALKLHPRLPPVEAEGKFPERKLHVFAKEKIPQRVLMFFGGGDADWCAEDLERQFGFKIDVVVRGRTYDPATVQKRFNDGEYVLLCCGMNPLELEKKPDSPIAEYIRRGGRAVYLSPRRGGTFGKPRPLPKGIPYDKISPKHLAGYGIACLSEGRFGKGTVVELGLKSPVYRHGIWQAVDEIYHCPELHDFEEKMAGFPYNEFYSLLYADLVTGREIEIEPFEFTPHVKKTPVRFDSPKRYIVANYLWIAEQYRKEFYDVLKEIGVNAVNCWIPGSYDAAQHGFPWTDGWGGVMSGEPFVLRALQEQGIWGGKAYGDDPVKKHWRSGCLSDPKWKPAAVKSFQRYAGFCRDNPPVNYAITDEMTLSAPWMNYHAKDSEPCRMEHCLKRFRAFLAEKYGTVANLNARWEMSYGSFDEVMPALTEEMRAERRAGKRNYAKWLEFRLFMDSVFAGASDTIVEAMKEVSGDIRTGQPNWTWMTPMAGIDPSKIVPGRTGSQDYGPAAWIRSFKQPDAPLLSWTGYSGVYKNGSGGLAKSLWGQLNRGATGAMLYNPLQRDVSHTEGYLSLSGKLTERGKALREALRPLVNGCGDLVNFSERAAMPVTVLYAQAGMGIAWLESDDKLQFDWSIRGNPDGSDYMNWFRSQEQWERVLNTLRLGWDYTSEPRLAERLKSAKAVVLPECWALSAETRRLLREFRARGGVVLGDRHAGLFDADGCLWPESRGKTVLDYTIPCGFRMADEGIVDGLRTFFAENGLKAPFEVVKTCDGKPATGIVPGLFKLPGAYVLLLTGNAVDGDNVMKGTRARVKQPETELELRLKRPVYVSDMVAGVAGVEKTQVFRWNPKEKPCALFLSDVKPSAPELSAPGWFDRTFGDGKNGDFVARTATPRILHRAVYAADGRELYELRANSPLTKEWKFNIALPAGSRLVVSDPATGLYTERKAK